MSARTTEASEFVHNQRGLTGQAPQAATGGALSTEIIQAPDGAGGQVQLQKPPAPEAAACMAAGVAERCAFPVKAVLPTLREEAAAAAAASSKSLETAAAAALLAAGCMSCVEAGRQAHKLNSSGAYVGGWGLALDRCVCGEVGVCRCGFVSYRRKALSTPQGKGALSAAARHPSQPGRSRNRCRALLQPHCHSSSPVVDLMLQCWPLKAVEPRKSHPGSPSSLLRCCSGTCSATILAVCRLFPAAPHRKIDPSHGIRVYIPAARRPGGAPAGASAAGPPPGSLLRCCAWSSCFRAGKRAQCICI